MNEFLKALARGYAAGKLGWSMLQSFTTEKVSQVKEKLNDFKDRIKRKKKKKKPPVKPIPPVKPLPPIPPAPPIPPIPPIPEPPVPPIGDPDPEEIEAAAGIQSILDLLEEGENYVSSKPSQAGAIMENDNASHFKDIIQSSIDKWGILETWKRLREWAEGKDLLNYIEKLMLGHYVAEFSVWGGQGGRAAWDAAIDSLVSALGVSDTSAILFK